MVELPCTPLPNARHRDKSGRVEVFLADRVEVLNPEGLAGAATRIMDVA